MNIANDKALHQCTSCQMCAAVCPTGAISIDLDKNGFYRPTVNPEECVDCSLCTTICYKFDNNVQETNSLDDETIYGASAIDKSIVKETTSGGIADILARKLISRGYKCIGVCYDTDRAVAYHKVAETEQDVIGFRGSKYIQSYTFSAFKQMVSEVNKYKFAIFGLPCQIYAIHRFLAKRRCREDHILIDLYCHGTPSLRIWQKYNDEIKHLIQKYSFDKVNFRSKIKGWGNFNVVMEVDNITAFISNNKKNEFYSLFFSDVVLNDSCYECKLRSTLRYTDIRLGDFWGKEYVNNHQGVSAVSIVTEKGKALFDSIKDEIIYEEHKYKDFLPYQSYGKVYPKNDELRKVVFNQLNDDSAKLRDVVRTIHLNLPLKQRIKHHLKHIVKMMPDGMISVIKKLYYKLTN